MSREAARSLVRAMRPVIESHFDRHGRQGVRATIFSLTGIPGSREFQAQMHGAGIVLDEATVTIGQTVASYDTAVGLAVGDTLCCVEMGPGDFVAFEVESDTDIPVVLPTQPAPLPYGWAQNGLGALWQPVFRDEFEGPLNTNVWTPYWFEEATIIPGSDQGANPSGVPAVAANVSVSGGQAHLIYDGTNGALMATNPKDGVVGHDGFDISLGYFETLINLPDNGSGGIAGWPAWWMDPQLWPNEVELDIFEGLSGQSWGTIHFGPPGGPQATPVSKRHDLTPGWHVLAAEWALGRVDYYYDSANVFSIVNSEMSGGFTIGGARKYLVLDMGGGAGTGGGTPPYGIDVEYVRGWQRG